MFLELTGVFSQIPSRCGLAEGFSCSPGPPMKPVFMKVLLWQKCVLFQCMALGTPECFPKHHPS